MRNTSYLYTFTIDDINGDSCHFAKQLNQKKLLAIDNVKFIDIRMIDDVKKKNKM